MSYMYRSHTPHGHAQTGEAQLARCTTAMQPCLSECNQHGVLTSIPALQDMLIAPEGLTGVCCQCTSHHIGVVTEGLSQ